MFKPSWHASLTSCLRGRPRARHIDRLFCPEPLEERRVLNVAPVVLEWTGKDSGDYVITGAITGLGAIGESSSDSYSRTRGRMDAKTWMQMAPLVGVNIGVRFSEDEFNAALGGSPSTALLSHEPGFDQLDRMVSLVEAGRVSHVVVWSGGNNFLWGKDNSDWPLPFTLAFEEVYEGHWTEEEVRRYVDFHTRETETAIQALVDAGAKVVLSGLPQVTAIQGLQNVFPNVEGRQRVTEMVELADQA